MKKSINFFRRVDAILALSFWFDWKMNGLGIVIFDSYYKRIQRNKSLGVLWPFKEDFVYGICYSMILFSFGLNLVMVYSKPTFNPLLEYFLTFIAVSSYFASLCLQWKGSAKCKTKIEEMSNSKCIVCCKTKLMKSDINTRGEIKILLERRSGRSITNLEDCLCCCMKCTRSSDDCKECSIKALECFR